jgi:UDP:flavonoid glycosyltransferase YjiC (YdhE family)
VSQQNKQISFHFKHFVSDDMMHAVFFGLSQVGHTTPSVRIVSELVKNSVKVTYVLNPWSEQSYENLASLVESAGATCTNLYDITSWRWEEGSFVASHVVCALKAANEVLQWIKSLSPQPSVIIYDPFAPIAIIIGKLMKLPLIASVSFTPFPGHLAQEKWFSPHVTEEIKSRHGVDISSDQWESVYLPFVDKSAKIILYTIPEFVKGTLPNATIEKSYFVGAMVDGARGSYVEIPQDFPLQEIKQLKQQGKSLVYMSLGTVITSAERVAMPCFQQFFEELFALLWQILDARPHIEVILATGELELCNKLFEGKPGNVRLYKFVPQAELLPLVDGMITHGGAGSVNEALYNGIPMIVIPFLGDQPYNAEFIHRAGLGFAVPNDSYEDTMNGQFSRKSLQLDYLADSLDRILTDSQIKENTLAISGSYRKLSVAQTVSDLLDWIKSYN